MAQEDPNRLAEWLVAARQRWPEFRKAAVDYCRQVRDEPHLLLETRWFRLTVVGGGLIVAAWCMALMARACSPVPPGATEVVAESADFHVVCSHIDCRHHFVVHRDFGFRRFPVPCPRCERESGARARQCHSATCRGRWVAPERDEGGIACPLCGARFSQP